MSNNMNEIEFPTVSYDEWKETAIKSLKGKPFESLFTKTIEGITLQPLYTQEMLIEKLRDELEKQVSTIRSLKASDSVQAAQTIYGDNEEQFFDRLKDSVERGNGIITIDSRVLEWNDENLNELAKYLVETPFKLLVESDRILDVFSKIPEADREKVKGYVIAKDAVELEGYPNVRTFAADTVPYHYEGAHVVQELALSLAHAAKYAEKSESFESFVNKFFVHFAIDTHFFQEIAKLRAFKVLWKAFAKAYNAEAVPVPVLAETSLRSFSKYDIYVNLLRAGNEAFAALIGGADAITVYPYDVLTKPTDQSIRIARNVVLVLKEESFVDDVLDPAGGSYFIETLTREYVEKAWELFLQIQEAGGIDEFEKSGKLQSALEEVYKTRIQQVETRKHSLIGTNIYANPADELQTETNPLYADIKRLAVPFETLREQYAKANPKIGILTFGKLKDFKPRADFVEGFFATAGVVPVESGEIESIEEAKNWLQQTDADYVVIAATNDQTKEIVPALLEGKKESVILDVAGKFPEEEQEWLSKGLNGFIYLGQNIVEKLTALLESLKEVQR
ncbi:methylmalonyl-CoA mutase family protein [Ureibacillus sp. FSL K6-3587]|uniref:methylmalonyl-CoA mutase family protein n=1 Tax=Ureibacillus sp. FSL K6-3587 TaxID=2954681 RepID=UPI003159818B